MPVGLNYKMTLKMLRNDIKYQYALDGSRTIDISSDNVVRGKEYTCLSCDNVLIPVLGEIRQKHFRHKIQVDCSTETYLHNLAKRIFFQTYNECLDNNRPYIIEYCVPVHCNACKEYGPCEIGHELKRTDLTKHFKEAFLESRDDEFIPDILLKSGSESLYVEIAVTHFVEENKASSGIRIIEIAVNNESDVELIISCQISEHDDRVNIRNFRLTPIKCNFADECRKTVNCFVLYPNGKSKLGSIPVFEYESLVDKDIYVERTPTYGAEAFINKVAELHSKGMKIKNCWLCTFHCLHFRTRESYCQLLKKHLENKNQAVDCTKYKAKASIPECGLIHEAEARLMEKGTSGGSAFYRYKFNKKW